MGILTKIITGMFTKPGIKLIDGDYIYRSSMSPRTYSFAVQNNGETIIIINNYDGAPDFLRYQNNGKYKNSNGLIFSFQMRGKGVYTGGLMGKDTGTVQLI